MTTRMHAIARPIPYAPPTDSIGPTRVEDAGVPSAIRDTAALVRSCNLIGLLMEPFDPPLSACTTHFKFVARMWVSVGAVGRRKRNLTSVV